MDNEALTEIRAYYPAAEVVRVMFRGERIGFGVALEPGDEYIGYAPTKLTAANKARRLLVAGGSLPD